jgi:hypothetical protein
MATPLRYDTTAVSRSYAEAVGQASILLVAMSFRPNLQFAFLGTVVKAVEFRGGLIDDLLLRYDLAAALDDVAQSAALILSAALRAKLPGIADELDEAFVNQLRRLLGNLAEPLPTM